MLNAKLQMIGNGGYIHALTVKSSEIKDIELAVSKVRPTLKGCTVSKDASDKTVYVITKDGVQKAYFWFI